MKLLLKNLSFIKTLFLNLLLTLFALFFTSNMVYAQTVVCPAETDLGTFNCNTILDVPPQVNSLQGALEVYGIEITGALPETGVTTVDSDLIFYCEENKREVTRKVIIYNDPNYDPFLYEEEDVVETCVFVITTEVDVEPPTFTAPPDTTISCTSSTAAEIIGEPVNLFDNCSNSFGIADITFTDSPPTVGSCPGESIFVRTWIATDVCGNESEPQDQVILRIPVAPEFTVPADIIVPCGTDPMDVSITGNVIDGYVACEEVQVEVISQIAESFTLENTPCQGATTYTKKWGALNGCGDATIKDQIIVVDCSDNGCSTIQSTVNCPAETNLGTFTCSMIGDPNFNQILEIPGLEAVIAPPYNMEIISILPQTAMIVEDSDSISFCASGTREVTRSITIYNDENFNFTYDAGEEIGSCSYTIVTEAITELPTFTVPPDIETNCTIGAEVEITGEPVISDDTCPSNLYDVDFIDTTTTPECDGSYIIGRNWFISDDCGNKSEPQTQVIIVLSIPPEFTIPPNTVVSCGTDPMDASITGDVTDATENCGSFAAEVISTIVDELTLTNTPCPGTTTYTKRWEAFSCTESTIKDQIIVVDCSENGCSALQPTVNCPEETNLGTFTCSMIGDPNFNQILEIPGLEAVMAPPYNMEINSILPQTAMIVEDSDSISFCASGTREVTRSITIYNDENFNFVYDAGEEIGSCSYTITTEVISAPPVFIAPPDIQSPCELGSGVEVTGEPVLSPDACSSLSYDISFTDGIPAISECPGYTLFMRMWTVTDACGNASELPQEILLFDHQGPSFTVPASITVPCGTNPMDDSITGNATGGFDFCEGVEVEVLSRIIFDLTQENTPCPGATTYIKRWAAIDFCGNATTKDQIIVADCSEDDCTTLQPTVNCPAETNLGTFDCNSISEVPLQVNTMENALNIYGIEITNPLPQTRVTTIDSDIIFYCESNAREVIREVIVYNDDNNNLTYDAGEALETCMFIINIELDIVAPEFSTPIDFVTTCPVNLDPTVPGITPIASEDYCPDLTLDFINFSDTPAINGECPGDKIIIRSWVAVDPCGNASEPQTQTIIIEDITGPEFTVPADIEVACGTDITDANITGEVTDGYDECEDAAITVNATIINELTENNTPCAGFTTYTKRWAAIDGCDNTTIKDQIIVVECEANCTNQDICVGDIVTDPLPGDCKCQVVEEQVLGCTNPDDVNYNAAANCDNGSCSSNNPIVVCPAETNLGTFDCNTIADLPDQINTIEEAIAAPYNIEITSALPQTRVITEDSDLILYCESNAREVIRSVIIYNDHNNNFSYDVGEAIETCSFAIYTEPDLTTPLFSAPADLETTCINGILPYEYLQTSIISDDNCIDLTDDYVNFSDTPPVTGKCPGDKIIVRSWTATDACGNASEPLTQKIIIKDETAPEFTVPTDIIIPCGTDPMDDSITGNVTDGFDECEGIEVAVTAAIVDDLTQENTPCPGSTAYTKRWSAVDGCGNVTAKDQIILVECPPDCSNEDICLGDIVTDPLPGECECQVVEVQVLGCTDPRCPNYDPAVNCDDGNCSFKIFDLALEKELTSTATDTDITFTITIYNQGDLAAYNIEIIDYIPAGLILNDANWMQSGANAVTTITDPLPDGDVTSIDINFTIDPNATSNTYTNYAEIIAAEDVLGDPGIDIDSTPDTSNENDFDENENSNEDDHDGAAFTLTGSPCENNNAGYFCE